MFGQKSDTNSVYEYSGKPLVQSVLQGFNGTVFCYGQTAAGKTYTMTGDEASPGFLPLALRQLFDMILGPEGEDREWLVRVGMVEVYCEEVRDLLEDGCPEVRVREDRKRGVYVEGREDCVTMEEEALEIVGKGQARRAVGSTDMNARSSRSHTIIRIVVESRPKEEAAAEGSSVEVVTEEAATTSDVSTPASSKGSPAASASATAAEDDDEDDDIEFKPSKRRRKRKGREAKPPKDAAGSNATGDSASSPTSSTARLSALKPGAGDRVGVLSLVDLAGSESARYTGATGQRLREAGNINKSLLALSRCIKELARQNQHQHQHQMEGQVAKGGPSSSEDGGAAAPAPAPAALGAHVNFRDSKLTRIL